MATHPRSDRLPPVDPTAAELVLRASCAITGLEAGHVAELRDGRHVVRACWGPVEAFGIRVDADHALDDTLCREAVGGTTSCVLGDVAGRARAFLADAVASARVRAYAGTPLRDEGGRLLGVLWCMDRTPRPALEPAGAVAFEALGTMLAGTLAALDRDRASARAERERLESVVHDLRTPLQALRHLGEDLAAGTADARRSGRQLEGEAQRVLGLVDEVLLAPTGSAREGAARRTATDLARVARRAMEVARAATDDGRRAYRLDVPPAPLRADVDGDALRCALEELLVNACRYSPAGGAVDLELSADGPDACFVVRDEGIGIEPGDLPHLTARSFRSGTARRAGIAGTGLGLAGVQAVAEAHDGTLSVSSTPGAGSAFTLRLPLRG